MTTKPARRCGLRDQAQVTSEQLPHGWNKVCVNCPGSEGVFGWSLPCPSGGEIQEETSRNVPQFV